NQPFVDESLFYPHFPSLTLLGLEICVSFVSCIKSIELRERGVLDRSSIGGVKARATFNQIIGCRQPVGLGVLEFVVEVLPHTCRKRQALQHVQLILSKNTLRREVAIQIDYAII